MIQKVILCPLYGDIKPDWKNNKELTVEMLDWPIVSSGNSPEDLDKKETRSYRLMLKSLMNIESFHFYVGLEADEKNEKLVLWNGTSKVDIYLKGDKLFQIDITQCQDFWYHFNSIVIFYGNKKKVSEEVIHGWA